MSASRSANCRGDRSSKPFGARVEACGGCLLRYTSAASRCSFSNSLPIYRASPQVGPQTGGENGSSGRLADRAQADANKAAAAARDADLRPILIADKVKA